MSETANLGNLPEFSVTELSAALRRAVEDRFAMVRVRGEISGLKFHSSGHVYFDLKDDKAVLNAVIWRGTAARLKLRPEAGLEVICTGKLSTYAGTSRYQIIVEQVELAGLGALMALLEERRKRLAAEGLFDAARKQPLPFLPEVIGVVTSPTGAVIRDIMHRLQARFPRRVLIWPVAVQGEKAAAEIAAAITGFNSLNGAAVPRPDLIIVARGGGSVEDLMAFNDEAGVGAGPTGPRPQNPAVGPVAGTPRITFAGRTRAPTPTAAAELAGPVRAALLAQTLDFERRMLACFTKGLKDRQRHLAQLARILPRPETLFSTQAQRLDRASDGLVQSLRRNAQLHRLAFSRIESRLRGGMITDRMGQGRSRLEAASDRAARAQQVRLAKARQHLDGLARLLDGLSHKAVLERGFALVRGSDGAVRRRAGAVQPGEALTLTFADGAVQAVAGGDGQSGPPKKPAKATAKAPAGKIKDKTDQGSLF